MKQELIRVIIVEPNKALQVTTIENKLEVLQEIVGGLIECVSITVLFNKV